MPKPKKQAFQVAEYEPVEVAQDLLDTLCTVKPGLTVGIEYDKQLAIDAFNEWGKKYGFKYVPRETA